VTTVDARLGEAFFHLTAVVHAHLYHAQEGIAQKPTHDWSYRRRYQVVITGKDASFARFAPSGGDYNYFQNFSARINAAGWRPEGRFPSQVYAYDVVLERANLMVADLGRANLVEANLAEADLEGAYL
jgi:uncharacterized protein YjbI with pentapeptide repeats